MTQFRERNPVPIGIAGIVVVLLLLVVVFDATRFPFIPGGGGHTVRAYFADAGDLQKSDDVRIAGIKVGEVDGVSLAMTEVNGKEQQVVDVKMTVDRQYRVPADSTADIKIKTLLGAMYVAITPGVSTQRISKPIPVTETSTPVIVTQAFEQLATNVDSIDTDQLAQSFTTLSQDFSDTPSSVSSTLKGLAAVSTTISSRDAALQQLLGHAQGVTTALASRDSEVTKLITDGQTVLSLVNQQRDVIHTLLLNTVALSQQLTALVAENRAILGPALTNLQGTIDILTKDQTNLDQSVNLLAPFLRDFANTLGNGEFFDTQVINLQDVGTAGCFTVGSTGDGSPAAGCH